MTVEIIVPWRGGCPHRARAWRWVRRRYAEHHADWTLTLAEAPAGPWAKALAVTPALQRSSADIAIVADADVWTDGLEPAVAAVTDGAPWATAHQVVHRLSEAGTAAVLGGEPWQSQPLEERPYAGLQGGGIVIGRRDVLVDAPLDPRFVGWGQEDQSWAMALHYLHAPAWRGTAPLVHLWHPAPRRMDRKRGSPESWALFRHYCAARQDPAAMRALAEEAKHVALQAAQQDLHPDPA